MADRLQYPPLPPYIQQQPHQIPPHHQQQPQDSLSSLPTFSDNSRMWQHPQQMRSHPQDISHPQMADLFRNQSMMRHQQAPAQSSSQQFSPSLAMPQLAANQNINGPPQPSQDLSTGQPQPSHMPPFNGISNPNAHMGSVAAQQRSNPLLQNFGRYDLGFPQNHHPHNGALAFANKQGIPSMQQQSRDQQHLQPPNHNPSPDMFSSPTMQNEAVRRPSPSHPPMPSQHIQNGMMTSAPQQNNTHAQPVPQTAFSSRPLQEQALYLRNMIQNLNNNIAVQRASPQDVDPMTKARVHATILSKREAATKMLNSVLVQIQAQGGGGQGQMPWMQQQQQQQQQGPSQPSFDAVSMPRSGLGIQSSQPQVQHQPGNTNPLVRPTQAGQVGGQNPLTLQPNSSSVQGNHVNVAGSPFPSQPIVPPNAASFNVPSAGLVQAQQVQRAATQPGGNQNPMLHMIPPLEKGRFEAAFKTFCNNKQIKIDQRLLTVNNRPIDLHILHTLVIIEGGEAKVQQKDLWSVIGGRMGFVQFPGTDSTEPSKSGPVIAQQLEHIYRQFLADFDRAYTASVMDSRTRNGALPPLNPSQLNMMVSMADQPVPQLKAQGLSEPIIQFIESHRSHLQRLRRDRESSHEAMKATVGEQTAQGQVNGMPHINQMAGLRPPPFLQPGQNSIAQPGGHNVETRQQLTHQLPPQANANRPGKEQVQHALTLIAKVKQETMNNIHNRPLVNIPAEHRFEYNTLIEQLFRLATEMDNKLAMLYIYTRREEYVRRLIVLVVSIQHQRNLLASPNPRFFISLDNLRAMHQQMQQATETCSQLFAALNQQKLQMQMQQQQQQQQQQQIQSGPRPLSARNSFPLDTPQIRPPGASNPLLPSPNLQPPQPQQPTPPQISLHPPPPKKKGPTPGLSAASRTATSTPSPVPTSAHTPGPASAPSSSTPLNTNTPTPALPPSSSSPPAPRSPKGKTSAKAKQAPAPTPKRRPSRTVPPPVPAESPAATVASSSTPNGKRPREEDDTVVDADPIGNNVSVANEPSPPKRIKTEWEIPQSEELKKKAAEVKLESVEDTNAFFEQMSELLQKTADNEGQESAWYTNLSETIGTILKGCPETSDNGLFGEALIGRESSPSTGLKDTFEEFIDYSFGQPDGQLDHEEGSKAHTPDLVSSSSTNLSPESNTDGENSLSTMSSLSDIRKDDPHDLRLGLWKEVDGGESAYYQPFEWKWDGPMSILEQSWAVGTS